jgi:membrane-bound lytic murein transglycosylase A
VTEPEACLKRRGDSRGLVAAAFVVGLLAACQTARVAVPPAPPPQMKTVTVARYVASSLAQAPALRDADLVAAWPALLASCSVFERTPRREAWQPACVAARSIAGADPGAMRAMLEAQFDVYRVLAETREALNGPPNGPVEARQLDLTDRGRLTGYYEPELNGSRTAAGAYTIPLYRVPDDLLTIDLGAVYPELQGKRVRGRIAESSNGKRVVPYWSRADIDGAQRLRGQELLWVDDPLEAFFLQIQGSGRVRLAGNADAGSVIRVGYADTNGQPYRSIGSWLVERGELTLEQASMEGIKAWVRANPQRARELLDQNPSYVFFRELPLGDPSAGPIGALNVALTAGVSVAADPQFVPPGAPLVLRSTHPLDGAPLERLVVAQDTGGAIRGPLRFDLFWGTGAAAGEIAGRQRHDVSAWLLVPKGQRPEDLLR